jgi:hypothetical protein
MAIPSRVKVGAFGLLFWIVLITILCLAVAFGPSVGLWFLLAPASFITRLVSVVVCGGLACVMGTAAFFLWAYLVSETTGL